MVLRRRGPLRRLPAWGTEALGLCGGFTDPGRGGRPHVYPHPGRFLDRHAVEAVRHSCPRGQAVRCLEALDPRPAVVQRGFPECRQTIATVARPAFTLTHTPHPGTFPIFPSNFPHLSLLVY